MTTIPATPTDEASLTAANPTRAALYEAELARQAEARTAVMAAFGGSTVSEVDGRVLISEAPEQD